MEFQPDHNVFQVFQKLGIRITWALLKIGYEEDRFPFLRISRCYICSYAEKLLETMETNYELIAQLIFEKNDDYDFRETLDELARKEDADPILQERKWRVYIVVKELETIPDEHFKGLLALADLWCSLGFPKDSPHVFQGQNNSYTPPEYYTQDMFDSLVEKNKKWIKSEIRIIKVLEEQRPDDAAGAEGLRL